MSIAVKFRCAPLAAQTALAIFLSLPHLAVCRVLRRKHRSNAKSPPRGEPFALERIMGVEPTTTAWEAVVLPINYIRR